ncbi:MAG: peptidyl-prolyl cis-trans isomerase [Acidobacteria bacterium]|nr:peptidyl-prolyl cis-trans isomerase [Acidobacteriota bacterium]
MRAFENQATGPPAGGLFHFNSVFVQSCLLLIASGLVQAQSPAPQTGEVPDETVVAHVGERPVTAGEVRRIVSRLPPVVAMSVQEQPKTALELLFQTRTLAAEAEAAKLDQQSPAAEELAYTRAQILARVATNRHRYSFVIPLEDQKKHYQANIHRYVSGKTRSLSVPFRVKAGNPKLLPEAQARQKVNQLLRELRSGADFEKLAKAHAADAVSPVKAGSFEVTGSILEGSSDSRVHIISTLKPGEVSEPFREESSFTIFQGVERKVQPFEEVQKGVEVELQQVKFREWFAAFKARLAVSVANADFFRSLKK